MSSVIKWNNDPPGDKRDLQCPETYSIKDKDVLPFLLDMNLSTIRKGVKPSQIITALKLTTEECLEKLRSPTRKYKIGTKKDAFSRCPEAIIFQNFQTGITYSTTLTITNQRTVPQNLNVYFDTSRFFTLTIDEKHCNLTKMAPGMSNIFNISFLPTDLYRDYIHEIHFTSEETSFSVPIFALGPRPLAYMPDKVVIPPTLVKVESSQVIVLKNNGGMPINYSQVITEPFSNNLPKAIVPPNGILEVKYSCYPFKSGHITGRADTFFRNDFCLLIELECDVKSIKVELDPHFVTFEDVYMGLCIRKPLTLYNSSEYPLHFAWKLKDHDDERHEILKLVELMSKMKEHEQKRYEKLKYMDIIDGQGHANIYERIFHDEKEELLLKQKFLFTSEFFEIIPKVGKVLPKSSFEFSVIFAPRQNISYYSAAYLDIEGTEKRVRVSLQGYGIGPPVTLTVNKLNAGQIYLTDKHQYEIALVNKGVIPATVTFQPRKTDWDGVLTCIPKSLTLESDSTRAFIVIFFSEHQGEFIEILDFKVEESGDHLQCIFSGNVICPLLKSIPEALEFGTISVGIGNTKEIQLVNDSRVSIKYQFEFEDDFEIKGKKYLRIVPGHGKVDANSGVKVKITFSCDVTSNWRTNLLLVMWNSRKYIKKILLTCTCDSPNIICEPEVVGIKFCFLNCDYIRTIELTNKSDLPGYVKYAPNEDTENSSIVCIPNQTTIHFNGRETVKLELNINVSELGPHVLKVQFSIIGGSLQTLCTICCNGQGPVVSYYPDEVNFGKICVLTRYEKKLTLVNDSPIMAKIRVSCKNNNSFRIEESESKLELKPEEQTDVTIWALFNSPGKNKDTIYIEIFQGDVCSIRVFGDGEGTSLLCEPQLTPFLNMGKVLTYKMYTQEIKITNKGNSRHKIIFSKRPNIRSLKEDDEEKIPSIFNIPTSIFKIDPSEEIVLTIKYYSKQPKLFSEEYYCYALIGKTPQIQTVLHFFLEAEFVDPMMEFSKSCVDFNLDVVGNVVEGKVEEMIHMDNKTGIPLQIHVTMDDNNDNFTIVDSTEKTANITHDLRPNSLAVHFSPIIKEKRKFSQTARLIFEYENHPKTDIINLRGEIMFPTLKLVPNIINMQCVPLGSTSHRNVVIQNVSEMVVHFKWFWLEKSIKITDLSPTRDSSKCITIAQDSITYSSNDFMKYIDTKLLDKDESHDNYQDQSLNSEIYTIPIAPEPAKIIYDSNKYLGEMKSLLSSMLSPYQSKKMDQLNTTPTKQSFDKRITMMFSLEPSEGVLKPNEYSIVTIGFSPPPNTEIVATAICKIQGGAEEHLFVMGKSSKLSYKLDKSCVNYGNQVFCEVCTGKLILTNNGLCSMEYKVIVDELVNLQAEMMDIHPKNGSIVSNESVTFTIDYFPGFPGSFTKSFTLELGYLEPVTVNIQGYAVLSQVFLHVPRPDMKLQITDCYKAVSWITTEYLELIQANDNVEIDDGSVDLDQFLVLNDWVYISYNDVYPSLMDIDMAMERIAAFNLITRCPKILKDHTDSKKIPNIPNFFPPPYCVDFGYVVRDIPVCYTVLIYNYGPIDTDIKLIEDNKTALLENEIKIEFRPRIISPGETIDLYVIFAPTKKKCLQLNKKIDDAFCLSVKHGPIITVQVKGEVTLPVLSLEHEDLYFEKVYCGDVLRRTIVLTNNGNVTSKWFATIIKPSKKVEVTGFFMIPNAGELKPGKKTHLDIYFAPADCNKIKRTLRININSNATPVYMNLFGQGLESLLMIVPTELKFQPTLSYFEHSLNFVVQNMSEIPMEFYFPTLDCDTERKKMIIQAYLKYNNVKQVFIPLKMAGNDLPEFFGSTYYNLIEKLRNKMISANTEPDENISGAQGDASDAKANQKSAEVQDPLAKYTTVELHSLLMDYMEADGFEGDCTTNTTYHFDDSSDKIEIVEPLTKSVSEDVERNGVLLIFHGARTTDYYRSANQVGIAFSISVYSIDRLIIESLVEGTQPIAIDILANIDRNVEEVLNPKTDALLMESLAIEDSAYDKILDKINIILSTKSKKSAKKSPTKEKESKASSEKSQGKNKDKLGPAGDCFLGIASDHIVDLLKPKIKGFTCLIIESLNSIFIPQENLALYTILRAAGPIQYISLIILSYTIGDFIKNEEKKLPKGVEGVVAGKLQSEKPKRVSPKTSAITEKHGKTSTKAGSEKVSKSTNIPGKGGDTTKKILNSLDKTLKAQLEGFESLRHEILHIVQYWDKRNCSLRKPYSSATGGKKETGLKDSARTMRNSVKKPTSSLYLDVTPSDIGLHLWLILNSGNERYTDVSETIVNCISQDLELQTLLIQIKECTKEKYEESETVFSVISKPSTRKNDKSSVFIIKNFQVKEVVHPMRTRSKSGSSIKVKRRRSSKSSRKSTDSRGTEVSLTLIKPDNDQEFSPKAVLLSGDLIKYQVKFCPRKCGVYKYTYTLETARDKIPYKIICNAVCEYPKLDLTPEVMFSRTLENYREKASYDHFVFIKDQEIFDFGSIIAGGSPEKCPIYSTTMFLRNASSMICDVTVSLSNDVFSIEPLSFLIPPNSDDFLKVSVQSTKIGTVTAELYISIKNNPQVEHYTLACSPCKLEFSLYPKIINFDKVPVSYSAKRVVRLTNTSPINLRWEFVEPGWAIETFNLSEENGYISLYSVNDISFCFNPTEEVSYSKRLPIRVFDVNSSSVEPCYTDNILIHADSVEYSLDVNDYIDYGELKGGVDQKRNLPITNKGKCEVILKIEMYNNPLENHNFVREYFKLPQLLIVIGAQKTENLPITFHPKTSFSVSNLLIFVINMVESIQSGHIVKSYKVGIGATSLMPSYKLCPQSQVNFGYVPIQNSKKLIMEVANNGRFSFSFVVQNYAKMSELNKKDTSTKKETAKETGEHQGKKTKKSEKNDSVSHNTNKKGNKSPKNEKSENETKVKSEPSKKSKESGNKIDKKKTMKATKLELGGFTITPSNGTVEPNETFVIEIDITPTEIRKYKEEILINIAEIEDIKDKKVIALKAIGCEPKINLKDFDAVFMEQYIVPTIENFLMPKNVDGCCIFCSSNTSLYFKLVCMGTSLTAKIYFKNIGYVTSTLTAKIDDSNKNVFSVTPPTKVLEPYSKRHFDITFKPNSLEEVNGSLEISYNASTDNKLVVQLYGQACLPQIELIKPLIENNEPCLNFGPICVGVTKKERIAFKNIGQIKCKVIVEMSTFNGVLTAIPTSTTLKELNVQDPNCIGDMKRDIMINLLMDEIAEFDIAYNPIKEECIQAFLTLHVIRNPYDICKILINANSYDTPVVLEELEPTKATILQSNSSLVAKNSIGYLLDLGYQQLNKLYKKSFLIRNRSSSDTYKFRIYCSSCSFIPEVGHLKPKALKEILVIFHATSPVLYEKVEIACNVNKIQYDHPDPNPLSWDDRQKFVYWITEPEISISSFNESYHSTPIDNQSSIKSFSSTPTMIDESDIKLDTKKKIIIEGAEPDHITLPDSLDIIPLYLTVSADYCRYQCETNFVNFMDTYIKETSSHELTVHNNGTVPINISWNLIDKNAPFEVKKSPSETNIIQNLSLGDISLKSVSSTSFKSLSSFTQTQTTLPIIISPEKDVIRPEETKTFKLFFTPQEENTFEAILSSNINDLHPNLEEIRIEVIANALPIPFYFEMEDGASANKDIIINFENIGVATESSRKLFLVNPTNEQVSFEIVTKNTKEFSYFSCDIPKGYINKKKKCSTMFSFHPPIFGSFMEYYSLNIPESNVQRNILLQGVCREPKVYFSETSISLKPTVPKVKTIKYLKLKNDEKFPMSFKFIKKYLLSETQQERLEAYPIVGKLKPQSETDIKITFTTTNIVSTQFHLKCLVEKLKLPLSLHVSADCINVQPSVSFTDKNGEFIRLSEDKVNILDLGYTHKGRRDAVQFEISNEGQTGMFYTWEFDSKPVAHLFKISVDTEKDFLQIGQTVIVNLIFEAIRTGIMKQFKINLKIMYGPVYAIHVNAISDQPSYLFSFNSYNFGYCLTQTDETNYYSTVLSFKNLDSKKIVVENLYEKTDYLSVDFASSTVLPGESRHIPIKFYPREVGSYKSEVLFLLDGSKHSISITGDAVNIKLELCSPKDKFINFGEVLVHTSKKYRVGVCNNSSARVDVHFDLFENLVIHRRQTGKLDKNVIKMPVLPPPPKEIKKEKNDKKGNVKKKEDKPKEDKSKSDKKSDKAKIKKEEEKKAEDRLAAEQLLKQQAEKRQEYLKSFMIVPSMFIDIPPKGKGYFDITFQPDTKMDFEEKIYFETQDYVEPFCVIKGSSIIPEFSLDKKELLFTGVIIGCSSSQYITVKNTGDIIGSFSWKIEDKHKQNIFAIEPKQGFVLPKNDMKIKITFLPKYEKCEFKVKAKCLIKEFKETLDLVLKGSSVKMPEPTAKITLQCNVREKADCSVVVANNTSEPWLLQCETSHEAFSTPKKVNVPPFNSTSIVTTYSPKKMTVTKADQATLFIKLPDGSGLLYELIGNSGPPAVKKKIEKEIRCKQNFFEIISIENWLTVHQTFKVKTELISPITIKTLYTILGFKTIELKGREIKNYKWGVYVVNEGLIEFRVTFQNPNTGEYEFFEISLKVLPSEPIETICFNTRVREPITKHINLENPVDIPITYLLECNERNLTFPKSIIMEPRTTAKINITFNPLQAEQTSTSINAKCDELGTYTYLIKMLAEHSSHEECVILTSELGAKGTNTIIFKNTFERTVEFTYKFDTEEFYMEKCGSIPSGDSSKITIGFEPSMLGRLKSSLFLTSPVAGEYVYPLEGEGILPTPKGPFIVKPNYPTTIEFKNPFNEDKQFRFYLDPVTFYCDFNQDIISSRKTARFLIYVRSEIELDSSCAVTGKLIIYSADEPELQWKYYLQYNRSS